MNASTTAHTTRPVWLTRLGGKPVLFPTGTPVQIEARLNGGSAVQVRTDNAYHAIIRAEAVVETNH